MTVLKAVPAAWRWRRCRASWAQGLRRRCTAWH